MPPHFLRAVTPAYQSKWLPGLLGAGESLNRASQRLLTSRRSMAQEFTEKDLSPFFRSNGTADPADVAYQALARNNFQDWRLEIGGQVKKPMQLSLAQLRALPRRVQITRHDCVEGWSAIGKWRGVPLHVVLGIVRPGPKARFVVFYCADPMGDGDSIMRVSTWRTRIIHKLC